MATERQRLKLGKRKKEDGQEQGSDSKPEKIFFSFFNSH